MERIETEILIAGGGIAGLAAAAAFSAEGFATVVVDPSPAPADSGDVGADLRSTAFLAPAIALLQRAGAWERLAPYGAELRVMRLADAGGPRNEIRETADFDATELGLEGFGRNLPNWRLRRELSARVADAAGARLVAGRVERVTPRSREVIATLSGGAQVRARLLVAADGRDSKVREAVGIGVRRWRYGQKALVFVVNHSLPHEGISTEIHRSGGPFTLVPLPDRDGGHQSAVVWMETGPRADALMALEPEAFEAALNERACGVLGPLSLAGKRSVWPILSQLADRLAGPRTALVAEAAHVIPPIGAQGLNMSLADVAALLDLAVETRAAGGDVGGAEMLARYGRARYPEMLARIAGVDLLNRAAMAEGQAFRDLRRAGLRALHGAGPLRHAAMRLGLGARR